MRNTKKLPATPTTPDEVTALLDRAVNLLGECEARLCLYSGTFALRDECESVRRAYDRLVRKNDVRR